MFAKLGRFTYLHRKAVVAVWAVVLIVSVVLGGRVFDNLSTETDTPASESAIAADRLASLNSNATPDDILVVVRGADQPAVAESIAAVTSELRSNPDVAQVLDFATTGAPQLMSTDGTATLLMVELANEDALAEVEATLASIAAPEVLIGGELPLNDEFIEATEADLQKAEIITLPIILILMLLIFGGIVAAGLPVIVTMVAVPGAFLVLFGITQVTDVAFYAVNVVTMLGLGLAVDYALLMVNRFREERGAGHDVGAAVERTVASAGKTVFFSGLTVTVALAGLLVYPGAGFRSLTYAGSGVVLIAMVAAVTLLPAFLGMWGSKIKATQAATVTDSGFFYRLSRFVQRRAIPIVVVVGTLLIALWLPFLSGARLENGDFRSLPRSSESRQTFEVLQTEFAGNTTDPIIVLIDGDAADADVAGFTTAIQDLDGVVGVAARSGLPAGLTVLDVVAEGPGQGPIAEGIVREIRAFDADVEVAVTGSAAGLVDFKSLLVDRLPLALGIIALATFVLLFMMTGSVVIPIKAIVMNVLSLGASMGILVWGFQNGGLSGILGFDSTGAIETFIPLIVFVFAFGLSMDYEVFLLSRIKEIYDETGDNDEAVARGLQRTGRIITSAALLIVIVFAGFALGDTLSIKMLGVGLSVAVIVDATIVRALLVPATMKLMGDWNWWAPAPLRRFHDRYGISEASVFELEPERDLERAA